MNKRIYITKTDMEKLRALVESRATAHARDMDCLAALEQELDRAQVVDPAKVPRNVITMHSRVRLKDLDSGEELIYRLVFPNQARGRDGEVSVLAPVGTALLGYRAGTVIEWPVPKGIRRLKVLEVLDQPESMCA